MGQPARKPTRKEKIAASEATTHSKQITSTEDVVSAIDADNMRDLINAALIESTGSENVKCISATTDVLHFVVEPNFDDLVPLMTSKESDFSQSKGNDTMTQAHQQTAQRIDDSADISDLLGRFGAAEARLGGMEQTLASIQGRVSALEARAHTITGSSSSGNVTDYSFSDMSGRVATGALTGIGLTIGATVVAATVQLARNYFDDKSEE